MLGFRPGLPLTIVLAGLLLAGAAGVIADERPAPDYSYATTDALDSDEVAPLSAVAQIGKLMFFDPALSASGAMSCATCHDPADHYAPSAGLVVEMGGPHLDVPGIRTVPSLTYKEFTPPFTVGPSADNDTDSIVQGQMVGTPNAAGKAASTAPDLVPQGGMFWDGRDDTLQEQPLGPLLSPFEMGNTDRHALFEKLLTRPYARTLEQLFGHQVMTEESFMISEAAFAVARYQIEEPQFHPFTSKYDFYLKGEATLTPAEARGLKLFDDPDKGNCAACHLDKADAAGNPPMFTDYEYEAIGVPRNDRIPANADPHYFDLGICGPLRSDSYARQSANCGMFKTPTLRNAATRHAFFHNGVYDNLTDVVRFYVLRETQPDRIYRKNADGSVDMYDDLPARYHANIDRLDAPFDARLGDKPRLDDAEIADVVAFLNTLTDGYQPGEASAQP
jgi:cytochrome c peroxidase